MFALYLPGVFYDTHGTVVILYFARVFDTHGTVYKPRHKKESLALLQGLFHDGLGDHGGDTIHIAQIPAIRSGADDDVGFVVSNEVGLVVQVQHGFYLLCLSLFCTLIIAHDSRFVKPYFALNKK